MAGGWRGQRREGGRPLARRLVQPFQRTRGALGVGLLLCCAGLARLAGAATITEFPLAVSS